MKNKNSLDNDSFDLKIKNSDYIRIGNYINSETAIEFECILCGKKSIKRPRFYNRTLCECKKNTNNFSLFGRKISNEEFDLKNKELDFIRLDNYINTNTQIKFKCKLCDKIINKSPKKIIQYICECKITKIDNHKEKFNLLLINKNLRLIGDYTEFKNKHCFECISCGEITIKTPNNILRRKKGCLSCSNYNLSHSKYILCLPNDIEVVDGELYISCDKYLKHKCKVCNYVWSTRPRVIIFSKCGCPNCSSSKGEKQIKTWLDNKGINYIKEYSQKIGNSTYRFDFYLPDKNLFIEFNGVQHYESVDFFGGDVQFEIIKNNDLIKENWIISNNKKLIKISYTENIEEILEKIK